MFKVFRNLNATVNINYTQGGSIPFSWKIVETGNASRYTNFANRGTGESSIRFDHSFKGDSKILL